MPLPTIETTDISAFEVLAISDTAIALREVYEVREVGGRQRGPEACDYPGVAALAERVRGPAGGLRLHIVPYRDGRVLGTAAGRVFTIYASVLDNFTCTAEAEAKAQRDAAAAYAATVGLNLDGGLERSVWDYADLRTDACLTPCRGELGDPPWVLTATTRIDAKGAGRGTSVAPGTPHTLRVELVPAGGEAVRAEVTHDGAACERVLHGVERYATTGNADVIWLFDVRASCGGPADATPIVLPNP